jgi:hypothetical protein
MARIPGFLVSLLLLALPVAAEFPLSREVIEPAPFMRGGAGIASNGDGFLVTWREGDSTHGGRVLAARLDRFGALLDRTPIRIADLGSGTVSVASDGHDYVVAYTCSPELSQPDTCLSRVTADGSVTQGERIDRAWRANVASTNGTYLLVYLTSRPGFPQEVRGVEVGAGASEIGTPYHLGYSSSRPGIAANRLGYFVVWSTSAGLDGVFATTRSLVGPITTFATRSRATAPAAFGWSVASDGHRFLVVWNEKVGEPYRGDLRAAVVSAESTAASTKTSMIVGGSNANLEPSVAWTGRDYIVGFTDVAPRDGPLPDEWWIRAGDVRSIRVSSTGEVISGEQSIAMRKGREAASAFASNGGTTIAVFEHVHATNRVQIEARVISAAGDVGEPLVVSRTTSWQETLAGVAGPGGTLFAWSEYVGEEQRREVFWQLVGDNDDLLYERGAAAGGLRPGQEQVNPAVSADLIAWAQQPIDGTWTDPAEILARPLFAPIGMTVPAPRRLGPARRYSSVAIAATPTQQLVVWVAPENRVVGMRLSPDGQPLDAEPIEIAQYGLSVTDPTIATDGQTFFVAWRTDTCFACITGATLYAIDSAVVSAEGIAGPVQRVAPPLSYNPTAVWDGHAFAVWYNGYFADRFYTMVRRYHTSGIPVDGSPIPLLKDEWFRAVSWNGREYVAAIGSGVGNARDLLILRLDRDLRIQKLSIASRNWDVLDRPVLIATSKTEMLGYERTHDGTSRVVARRLDEPLSPARRRAAGSR